jgi:hypothetical protein
MHFLTHYNYFFFAMLSDNVQVSTNPHWLKARMRRVEDLASAGLFAVYASLSISSANQGAFRLRSVDTVLYDASMSYPSMIHRFHLLFLTFLSPNDDVS